MRLLFADLSLATLKAIVNFTERGIVLAHWEKMQLAIAPNERQQIEQITAYLLTIFSAYQAFNCTKSQEFSQ